MATKTGFIIKTEPNASVDGKVHLDDLLTKLDIVAPDDFDTLVSEYCLSLPKTLFKSEIDVACEDGGDGDEMKILLGRMFRSKCSTYHSSRLSFILKLAINIT